MRKFFVLGVVVALLGTTIGSSAFVHIVKASSDNERIQVTMEACGLRGFKNTVRLTPQQYQDLLRYIQTIRGRLNTARSPNDVKIVFQDALQEFLRCGLLPASISTTKLQHRILRNYADAMDHSGKLLPSSTNSSDDFENSRCLTAGFLSTTINRGAFLSRATQYTNQVVYNFSRWYETHYKHLVGRLIYALAGLFLIDPFFLTVRGLDVLAIVSPLLLSASIGIGCIKPTSPWSVVTVPSQGWIYTNGANGVVKYSGKMLGNASANETVDLWIFSFFPGILEFSGLKITLIQNSFYLGSAGEVKISPYQ